MSMNEKVKLGTILKAFEDAFMAGYEAALIDKGEVTRRELFQRWVEEELKLLK